MSLVLNLMFEEILLIVSYFISVRHKHTAGLGLKTILFINLIQHIYNHQQTGFELYIQQAFTVICTLPCAGVRNDNIRH